MPSTPPDGAGSRSDALFAAQGAPRAAEGRRRGWTRRRVVAAIAAAVVLIVGGIVTALQLLSSNGSTTSQSAQGDGSYTTTAPWRLRVDGTRYRDGCTVTLTELSSGTTSQPATKLYGIIKVQVHQTGSFRWQANDRQCLITPLAGSGSAVLPFTQAADGDTDAFPASARGVDAQVKDYRGNSRCELSLFDASNGQELDQAPAPPGADIVTLSANGRSTVYLHNDLCVVRVSAHP